MAATTLFTIGAGATCADGVRGMVSRDARGRALSMSPMAAPRLGRAFRWPFTAAR